MPLRLTGTSASIESDLDAWEQYRHDHHYSKEEVRRGPNNIREAAQLVGWTSQRDITRPSIVAYLAALAQKDKEKTRRNKYAMLGAFLEWSIDTGRRNDRPDKGLRVAPRGGRRRKKPVGQATFQWDEVRRLIGAAREAEALPGRWDTPRSLIYQVAATTGLRKSELKRLQWEWIHNLGGERSVVILPDPDDHGGETSKSRSEQEVLLPPETAAALRDYRSPNAMGAVFPRVPDHETVLADMDRAGVPRIDQRGRKRTFKSLRSSFNTALAARGVTLEQRQAMMRHTDPMLTATTYLDRDRLDLSTACKSLPVLDLEKVIHNRQPPEGGRFDSGAIIAHTGGQQDENGMIAYRDQLERAREPAPDPDHHSRPEWPGKGADSRACPRNGADRVSPADPSRVTPRGFEPSPVGDAGRPQTGSGSSSEPGSENEIVAQLLELDARRSALLARLIRGGGS